MFNRVQAEQLSLSLITAKDKGGKNLVLCIIAKTHAFYRWPYPFALSDVLRFSPKDATSQFYRSCFDIVVDFQMALSCFTFQTSLIARCSSGREYFSIHWSINIHYQKGNPWSIVDIGNCHFLPHENGVGHCNARNSLPNWVSIMIKNFPPHIKAQEFCIGQLVVLSQSPNLHPLASCECFNIWYPCILSLFHAFHEVIPWGICQVFHLCYPGW